MAAEIVSGVVKSVKMRAAPLYSGDAFKEVVWDTEDGEQTKKSFSSPKRVGTHVESGRSGEYFFSGRKLFAFRDENGTEIYQWSNMDRNLSLLLFAAATAWTIFLVSMGESPGFVSLVFLLAPAIFVMDIISRSSARAFYESNATDGR